MLTLLQGGEVYSVMSFTENFTTSVQADEKKHSVPYTRDYQLHSQNLYLPNDDSSTDDDTQEPVPESFLNLSDEESIKNGSKSLRPDFSNDYKKTLNTYSSHKNLPESTPSNLETADPVQPKIYSSPNSADLSSNRQLFQKQKLSSFSRKFSPKTTKNDMKQSDVIKLPYVSRSSNECRKKSVKTEESKFEFDRIRPCKNQIDISSFPPDYKLQGKEAMSDTLSSRIALSSSGYSSSGSGNSSFSSSTSYTSYATTSSPLAASCDKNNLKSALVSPTLTIQKPKLGSPCRDLDSKSEGTETDEDAFPLSSWLQTSEFTDLHKVEERINKRNPVGEKLQDQYSQPGRCKSFDGIDFSNTTSTCKSSSLPADSHQIHIPPQGNLISMVEKPETDKKPRVRLRMSGSRSKKDEAVRSSLAFAFHARGETDILPDPMQIPVTRTNIEYDSGKQPSDPKKGHVSLAVAINRKESGTWKQQSQTSGRSSKRFNSVSSASARNISDNSYTTSNEKRNPNSASLRSLNSAPQLVRTKPLERRSSFRDRLIGTFSFQNIKKAISSEKLEENKSKTASNSYLNEDGEDINKVSRRRPQSVNGYSSLRKPSIQSMFGSVRMRSKRIRERQAIKERNSIACDPKPIPEYDCSNVHRNNPPAENEDGEVGKPGHFRPIGRVVKMNVRESTMLIEMIRPQSGSFGFYVARKPDSNAVCISGLSDSYPDKMFAGLMKTGDEIIEINGKDVSHLSLDEIYDLILENDRLVVCIRPSMPDTR